MRYFLVIDYILSSWFSKTRDKIVPGTAFLFLNKVVFIWASIFFGFTGLFKIKIGVELYVGILVLVGAIIMYGFQNKLENFIRELAYEKKIKSSKQELLKGRLLGLLYFGSCFILIFITLLIFH